jgi:hypothetical protein
MMGTEMVPETSVITNQCTWKIVQAGFINLRYTYGMISGTVWSPASHMKIAS